MKVMIIVGSVRPGRVGLSVAEWVRDRVQSDGRFEIDFVDLAELALPFMDEPAHPSKRQYTKPHTIAWSERVDAADAVILVTPEYNHSFSPALKNALDFLNHEWWRMPVTTVSYGGVSAGTRGVTAIEPVLVNFGMVKTTANVEIPFVATHIVEGVFQSDPKFEAILEKSLDQLEELATALGPIT